MSPKIPEKTEIKKKLQMLAMIHLKNKPKERKSSKKKRRKSPMDTEKMEQFRPDSRAITIEEQTDTKKAIIFNKPSTVNESMAEYIKSDVKIHERVSPSRLTKLTKQPTPDSDLFTRKKLNEFFAAWLFHYKDTKR